MWSFNTLAPGMDTHVDAYGTGTTYTASPSSSSSPPPTSSSIFSQLKWAMRGSYQQACSAEAAVAVDAASPDDAAHHAQNTAIVSASLSSPNRIVLGTSTHAFSARATAAVLTDPIDGAQILVDSNKAKAMRHAVAAAAGESVGSSSNTSSASPTMMAGGGMMVGGISYYNTAASASSNTVGGSSSDVRQPREHSCRFVVQQLAPPPPPPAAAASPSSSPNAAAAGVVESDPSILIGLSCTYHGGDDGASSSSPPAGDNDDGGAAETQHQYNTRTLSTPLLWEEPRSFFIDCRRSGMYLWSEDGVEYGRKIFDKCLETPTATSSSSSAPAAARASVLAQAEIELKWHDALHKNGSTDATPQIRVALMDRSASAAAATTNDNGGSNAPHSAVAVRAKEVESFTWRLPKGTVVSDLVPSVTFLTEYCRATILPKSTLDV